MSRGLVSRFLPCLLVAVLVLPPLLTPVGASSQAYGDLALAWTLGDYRAPLLCEVDGTAFRVLRRIRIFPKRGKGERPTVRVQFYDLDSPGETRCYSEEGAKEENLIGTLELIHEARRDRPDLADREFTETLRREGGFDFKIKSGRLRLGTPGMEAAKLPVVDLAGGSARVTEVKRGQDAFLRLSDFGERRKLVLRIETPDGSLLQFELAQLDG